MVRNLFFLFAMAAYGASIPYPDFRTSVLLNGIDGRLAQYEKVYSGFDSKYVELFEELYRRNIAQASMEPFPAMPRIPKIVHQIWLGGSVPELYRDWMQSWANLQGWEYKLWTDEEVAGLFLHNRDLFDAAKNLGERSDIARLEILYEYGGVYVDTDFLCVRPEFFDILHHQFDFYIGVEPLFHGFIVEYQIFKFCNAIIGSAPKHPLMKDLIINLKANHLAYFDGTLFQKTGPSYLTRIMSQYELRGAHAQRNLYLPCTLFYPFSIRERGKYLDCPEKLMELFPETAAIHYWTSSWNLSQKNRQHQKGKNTDGLESGGHGYEELRN